MSTRTQRVVVGYDGSPAAGAALDWAADEAGRRGATLFVVYAMEYGALVGGPVGNAPWLPAVALDAAGEVAAEGVERASARVRGLSVGSTTQVGRPSTALVEASQHAQLVVVGTRGRGEVACALLGSTAAAVSSHAHCPVVVVPRHADAGHAVRGHAVRGHAEAGEAVAPGPSRPVVIGVDGSPAAESALRYAARLAAGASAPLAVVCAWHRPRADDWTGAYWFALEPGSDPAATAERAAREVAYAALVTVHDLTPGVAAEATVSEAAPATAILAAAGDHAGMVVVGARGRGALGSLLLGSVSHRVLHGASCPVTVVRSERVPATTRTAIVATEHAMI